MNGSPDHPDRVERNRSAPARGTPPGREPTGWRNTRLAFAVTAGAALVATVVLVVVAVVG